MNWLKDIVERFGRNRPKKTASDAARASARPLVPVGNNLEAPAAGDLSARVSRRANLTLEDDDSAECVYMGPDGDSMRKRTPPAGADGGRDAPSTRRTRKTPPLPNWTVLDRFWEIRQRHGYISANGQLPYVEEAFSVGGDDVVLFMIGVSAEVSELLYQKTVKGWDMPCVLEIPARSTGLKKNLLHIYRFTKNVNADHKDVLVARLMRISGEDRTWQGKECDDWPNRPPLTKSVAARALAILRAPLGDEKPETGDAVRIPVEAFDFLRPDFVHYDPRLTHFRQHIGRGNPARLGDVCEASFSKMDGSPKDCVAITREQDEFRNAHFDLSRFPALEIGSLHLRSTNPEIFPPEYLAMFTGTWFFTAHCLDRSHGRRGDYDAIQKKIQEEFKEEIQAKIQAYAQSEYPDEIQDEIRNEYREIIEAKVRETINAKVLDDILKTPIPVPTDAAKRVAAKYWELRGQDSHFQIAELNSLKAQARQEDPLAVYAEDLILVPRNMPDLKETIRSQLLWTEFDNDMAEVGRGKEAGNYKSCSLLLGTMMEGLLIDWLMELKGESITTYRDPNKERWGGENGYSNLRKFIKELQREELEQIVIPAELVRKLRNKAAHPQLVDSKITKEEVEEAEMAMRTIMRFCHSERCRNAASGENESTDGVSRYVPHAVDMDMFDRDAASIINYLTFRTPPPQDFDGSSVTPVRGNPIIR